MTKIPRSWFLIAGGVLILLALVLAVHTKTALHHSQAHQHQQARVVHVLRQIEDACLTCHANYQPPGPYPAINTGTYPIASSLSLIPNNRAQSLPRVELDTQLASMGRRILELPDLSSAPADEVIGEWVLIFEQTRVTADPVVIQTAMDRLAAIDDALQWLELQTLPYTLDQPETAPEQINTAVLLTATAIPMPAMLAHVVSLLADETRTTNSNRDPGVVLVSPAIARTAQRRGPPVVTYSDSFLEGMAVISL